MNNHINNFLEHYIDLQVSPEYAVLLSGEWGSGKTFFINSFLENKKSEYEDKFTFIKISLFGIKSIDEVHMQIIFQLLGAEEGGKLESVLKLGSNVIDYFAKKINLGFNDIPIDQILKKLPNKSNKERIFIFDDLERIAIEIPEIFGYINILVEQLAHKCILLAHESPLINQDLYSTFKEKVIGKTFNVQQDFKSAFDTFVELANVSNKTISDNEQSIKNIFDTATYGNLRHIRQTILDFEYFYENIEKKFTEHQELMQEIIKLFFVFSIEIKSGKLQIDELLNFEKIYSYEYYKKMREVEESGKEFQKDNLHIITDKYSFIDRKNLLLSEKNWVKIFKTGILSKEEISENLNNCKYFMKTSPQEWIQLYHFSSLEDEEFNTILEKIVNKFEKNEYKQHEVLLHVISILLALSKYNLYDKSQTEIVDQAKQNIDKCINFWKFKHDLSLRDGALGYQYWDNNDTNFQDIKKYMIEKNSEAVLIGLIDIGKKLINSLIHNNMEEVENILSQNSTTYSLHDLPLFSKINENDFFDAFLQLHNSNCRDVILAIEERYRHSTGDDFIDELEFWKKFAILIDNEIEKANKSIKVYWLKVFKKETLEDKIIAKLQNAKDRVSK